MIWPTILMKFTVKNFFIVICCGFIGQLLFEPQCVGFYHKHGTLVHQHAPYEAKMHNRRHLKVMHYRKCYKRHRHQHFQPSYRICLFYYEKSHYEKSHCEKFQYGKSYDEKFLYEKSHYEKSYCRQK